MSDRPSVTPDLLARFRAYHERKGNSVWGSLHVVLDDLNTQDCFVQGCLDDARKNGDDEGAELATILLSLSRTQRAKIARMA